ncbi:NAD-dependent succinate-semialdehyde dehydrogenase [Corynebacterium uterequi]|nr:NAD-dependent succinate-semialdehyde dehydrogenase [Corynebacterium uterequi]
MTTSSSSFDLDSLLTRVPRGLFIDGDFVSASDGATFDVLNPSDGTVLAAVASASHDDARRALDVACRAHTAWARTATRSRSEILYRAYELIHDHADELAYLQSAELGRALADSSAEVTYAAEFFRWFAEEAVRVRGDYRPAPGGSGRIVVTHEPVGPCLAITPWNFPLAMGARKIAPALAAGCTMVLKPASKTPLTMLFLAQLLRDAGLPDGVLAVVPTATSAAVSDLLDDARLRKFTFTGSTAVGQELAAKAARHSMKTSLELGGNAPFIVAEDADVDAAAEAVAVAKMRGAGQVCIAANRFLVHESIKDAFLTRAIEHLKSYRIGRGTDPEADYGALSGQDQVDKVRELVDDALVHGGVRHLGDSFPDGLPEQGCYFPVTVLSDFDADARINDEEIFGPVLAVRTFADDEEALRLANATSYGLAAYVFSENLAHALTLAEGVEAGMVAVNRGALSDASAPFGGVKQSGLGREGGFEGIHEYLEPKYIALP